MTERLQSLGLEAPLRPADNDADEDSSSESGGNDDNNDNSKTHATDYRTTVGSASREGVPGVIRRKR